MLKDIKDVLDEIKMVKAILVDQLSVLDSSCLPEFFPDPHYSDTDRSPNPRAFKDAKMLLEGINSSFDVMETHAKDVERGVSTSIIN